MSLTLAFRYQNGVLAASAAIHDYPANPLNKPYLTPYAFSSFACSFFGVRLASVDLSTSSTIAIGALSPGR